MRYDESLAFLKSILQHFRLQMNLFEMKKDVCADSQTLPEQRLSIEEVIRSFPAYFPTVEDKTIYYVEDAFLYRYVFLMLPHPEQKEILLIGPYTSTDITRDNLLELGERLKLTSRQVTNLEIFYATIPVIKEENYLFAVINAFAERLWGERNDIQNVDLRRDSTMAFLSGPLNTSDTEQTEEDRTMAALEARYRYENELIETVASGNTHKVEALMANFSNLSFENRTQDQIRNMKNYCIIMNTLFRKAAERGGVHPVWLNTVSSDFAKRIEALKGSAEISPFMLEIIRTYCRLVQKHSVKNFSPAVQKTILRIESDLTQDLSLKTLAEKENVHPNYLSGLFKKETGETLTAYINKRRIKKAKYLLKNSHLQIQTIAQYCGLLDLHYFCRLFKSMTGKTPTDYRHDRTLH